MADYLTAELPGTGGTLKQTPEDFEVEEIPLYLPCDDGEHLYLDIEKRGVTTHEVVRQLSRSCRLHERDIGYAGLKDAQALTRQLVSIPADREPLLDTFEMNGVRVLSTRRHGNKLRLGHLAGNRFRITLRDTETNAGEKAQSVIDILSSRGVPNLFGPQRYGLLGNNALVGRAMLRGEHQQAVDTLLGDPEMILNRRWREGIELYRSGDFAGAARALPKGCRNERSIVQALARGKTRQQALERLPRSVLRLFLSAWQSRLFDRLVLQRLQKLGKLERGDLAYKHANGACFLVEDQVAEQDRADAFEISPTGPMFGSKMPLAEGSPGERERVALTDEELPENAFKLAKGLSLKGERRPLRVPLNDAKVTEEDQRLVISFSLPRGSFATTVMREIMKNDTDNCIHFQEG